MEGCRYFELKFTSSNKQNSSLHGYLQRQFFANYYTKYTQRLHSSQQGTDQIPFFIFKSLYSLDNMLGDLKPESITIHFFSFEVDYLTSQALLDSFHRESKLE
ncbi:hypothetical protein OXYTRIMIC_330 [Oxytricha trifallax]|uniref:Uncharacterized protein n=1 Tax=Oxytricha trifallax TaxID=1172189 RepID=A0A073HZH8_9SPIT|nr:hypothetical protein OXYTRIMIC_330 [Oxytricha trifallax]